MLMRRVLSVLVGASVACGLAGCSASISLPATAPVTGKVLYKGKPLAGVLVTFHPQFDMGAVDFMPSGVTDRAGQFMLSTATAGDGAPPGAYAVTFVYPVTQSDRKNSGIEVEVDFWKGKYADPGKSSWKIQVQKGANDLEPFRLD